jgi:hypothetical protein
MHSIKHVFGLALLAALMPTAATAAPLRTVVYHFNYDSQGFGSGADIDSQGRVSQDQSGGHAARSGRITVDVVQATADDGLVVDVGEDVDRWEKPLQTLRCAIYGTTSDVVCNQGVDPTGEERALLSYLGRSFFDPSRLDAKQHWQSSPRIYTRGMTTTNDYTVTKTDGDLVTISVDREERGGGFRASTTGTVVYDAAMTLPDSVKLSAEMARDGGEGDLNVDLELLSDSMASPSPNPH